MGSLFGIAGNCQDLNIRTKLIHSDRSQNETIDRFICYGNFPDPGDVLVVDHIGEAIVQKVQSKMIDVVWDKDSEVKSYKLSVVL